MISQDFDIIRAIESDIGKNSRGPSQLPPALEQRRLDLLTSYLGYEPRRPLPLLHVVGDSHVGFFAGTENLVFLRGRRIFTGFLRPRYIDVSRELLPVFRVFHLGPATAWQAGFANSSTYAFEKLKLLLRKKDIPPGASILLVFGEIDVRCHIPKTVVLGKNNLEQAVADTVERFLKLPLFLKDRGYKPAIWLPSLNAKLPPTDDIDNLSAMPAVGNQPLRDEAARLYCKILRQEARAHGLKCCGLAADIPVSEKERYLDDMAHLSQRLMPYALEALVTEGILPLVRAGR